MRTVKKLAALLCAGAMLLGLAACGGGGAAGGESVVETLIAAEEKLNNAQSAEFAAFIDLAMVATEPDGTTEEIAATAEMDLSMITEPLKLKGNVTLNMAELGGSMGMGLYAVQDENEVLSVYLGMMGSWVGYTVDMSEFAALTETEATQSELYTENEASATKIGEETIGEVTATKYGITISGASMEKMMVEQGVIDSLAELGDMGTGMEIDWADLYSDMADMTMYIWIDAEGYPLRYEFDILAFANQMMQKAMAQTAAMYGEEFEVDVSFTKLSMVFDILGIDTVEDFEIPAEVVENAYFY